MTQALPASVVDCDPSLTEFPLALRFAASVRAAAEDPNRRTALARLKGSVVVIVDDVWAQFTLRFDYGRLSIHSGVVGVPDMTLRGPEAELESLLVLPFRTEWPVLLPLPLAEFLAVRRVVAAWAKRSLKVYGAFTHPRLLLGVLLVLASP